MAFFQNLFRGGAGRPPQENVADLFAQFLNRTIPHQEENTGPPPTPAKTLASLREECLNLDDINNGNGSCSICFEEQHVGDLAIRLQCGHAFHKACVWPWLKKHNTCPVCRYEVGPSSGSGGMSSKEQRERRSLQRKKDQARRQREEELRRKRTRLQRMDSMDRRDKKRSANVARTADEGCIRVTGSDQRTDTEARPGNPFDLYTPSSEAMKEEEEAGAGHCSSSKTFEGNPFDDPEVCMQDAGTSSTVHDRASRREYSNTHYAGREENDGVWEVSQTLPVSQLKKVLVHIGLGKEASQAVDKRDLLESLSNGCRLPELMKLPTRELKRRLNCLGKDANDLVDKAQVAKRLRSRIIEYLYTQCF